MDNKERKLIKLKDGDKLMTLEEVYKQFERFLHACCKSWLVVYDQDDLMSVAYYGLHKAFDKYDISKGLLFMTFVSRLVSNELLMYHRKNKKYLETSSLNTVIADKDGKESIEFQDFIPDISASPEEDIIEQELLVELREAIKSLEPREQEVITRVALKGENQKDVAESLNISQSYVARIQKLVIRKLKNKLEGKKERVTFKDVLKKEEVRKRMPVAKIKKEQLKEELKQYGTGMAAYKLIGEKYDLEPSTVKFHASNMGLLKELKEEKAKEEAFRESVANKPQIIEGCIGEYEIEGNVVTLKSVNGTFKVDKANINNLILELQEINQAM